MIETSMTSINVVFIDRCVDEYKLLWILIQIDVFQIKVYLKLVH